MGLKYQNSSSKTTSSWWLCSQNECCVKADSEKVRQRETDRAAGHIHLGTHHHYPRYYHHHFIMICWTYVLCAAAYIHLGTHHHHRYYPQCCWTFVHAAGHKHQSHHNDMHLDICISVIIIVIVNTITTTIIISIILCSWAYTTQCSSPSSSWIIIISWEDNTAWNEAQVGHCLTVQRDIKCMKRNKSHLQIIFPFYGSSI